MFTEDKITEIFCMVFLPLVAASKNSIPRPLNIVLPLSRLSIAQTGLALHSLLHRFLLQD